jgi:transcription termination factor Rho
MVRQNGLRKGDHVTGAYRPAGGREKNPALLRVDKVMDLDPEQARQRPRFDDLTPVYPHQRVDLTLGDDSDDATARAIDLLAPIGLGQRGTDRGTAPFGGNHRAGQPGRGRSKRPPPTPT